MRDYQAQWGGKYRLPKAVYHQTLWQIRDYYRIREKYENVLTDSAGVSDGQPKGKGCGDSTAAKAIKRIEAKRILDTINDAKNNIPVEYRIGVWNNIMHGQNYPMDAGRSTYARYKAKFICEIANKLFLS